MSTASAPPDASRTRDPRREHEVLKEGQLIRHRQGWKKRLNAWRKHSPFNPYWIDRLYLRRSAAELARQARGTLLDVGGAERPYGELFAPFVSRYLGLEYPAMVDNLVPEIWKVLPRVRAVVDIWGDGTSLPFADACVETVLLSEVMEHVPEPEALLREAFRVLRPGGRLLLTVPFMAPLHQLPYDYYRYTEGGLRVLLERAGFRVESIAPRGNSAAATGSLVTQYLVRTFGAKHANCDGSVTLSRWRAPFVLPLVALAQLTFATLARLSRDHTMCMGWSAVAVREP